MDRRWFRRCNRVNLPNCSVRNFSTLAPALFRSLNVENAKSFEPKSSSKTRTATCLFCARRRSTENFLAEHTTFPDINAEVNSALRVINRVDQGRKKLIA